MALGLIPITTTKRKFFSFAQYFIDDLHEKVCRYGKWKISKKKKKSPFGNQQSTPPSLTLPVWKERVVEHFTLMCMRFKGNLNEEITAHINFYTFVYCPRKEMCPQPIKEESLKI